MSIPGLTWTQVPNCLIENVDLSASAFRIAILICRKTIGWHKEADSISLSQLRKSSGMANATVVRAIEELEKADIIQVDRTFGAVNKYTLNIQTSSNSEQVEVPASSKFEQVAQSTSLKFEHTKESLTPISYPTLKEKEEESTAPEIASDFPTPPSTSTGPNKRTKLPTIIFDMAEGMFFGVEESEAKFWKECYPAVDVDLEIGKMVAWLRANPRHLKKNYRAFITRWLSSTQEKGGNRGYSRRIV